MTPENSQSMEFFIEDIFASNFSANFSFLILSLVITSILSKEVSKSLACGMNCWDNICYKLQKVSSSKLFEFLDSERYDKSRGVS